MLPLRNETIKMSSDARLVTLPKELQLVQTPDRARSASDARRLAHLAKKVYQFNTLHVGLSLSTLDQSAASLASVIATRQERALQQRSQLLKSRSTQHTVLLTSQAASKAVSLADAVDYVVKQGHRSTVEVAGGLQAPRLFPDDASDEDA